jgi:hypothetical protein
MTLLARYLAARICVRSSSLSEHQTAFRGRTDLMVQVAPGFTDAPKQVRDCYSTARVL